MTLNELLEKSTIVFPKSICLSEAEKLLLYVAKELPGNIPYHISSHKNLFHEPEGLARQDGTVMLTGSICYIQEPFAFDSFQTEPDSSSTELIAKLKFQLIPGYDELEEYNPETLKLWDNVRRVIMQYFKVNSSNTSNNKD
jgi:hypothetical protein